MTESQSADAVVQGAISTLAAGRDLDALAARNVMVALVGGAIPDAVIVDFLAALAAKGPTASEIEGFLQAMRQVGVSVELGRDVVDIVGTGGDGHHSVNISTMAAIALATTGVPVVKHGNRASTSLCGAADVLEALGVALNVTAEGISTCLDEVGIAFCFAPVFHPAMKHVATARKTFGKPSIFNILGPLANPARASTMLVGTADAERAGLVAEALAASGVSAVVVTAADGMDEVSTRVPTHLWVGGQHVLLDPREFGLEPPVPGALDGGDAQENAEVARAVLGGLRNPRIDAIRECVALNAAVARALWVGARDLTTIVDATARELPKVREVMLNADAGRRLHEWAAASTRLCT